MNTPWDAQQREWLQAMGYEVMVSNAFAEAPLAVVSTGGRVCDEAVARPESNEAWPDGPLLRALLRAARTGDRQAVAALLPPPAQLRGNAAAKRSLWPRLRALRQARGH